VAFTINYVQLEFACGIVVLVLVVVVLVVALKVYNLVKIILLKA